MAYLFAVDSTDLVRYPASVLPGSMLYVVVRSCSFRLDWPLLLPHVAKVWDWTDAVRLNRPGDSEPATPVQLFRQLPSLEYSDTLTPLTLGPGTGLD